MPLIKRAFWWSGPPIPAGPDQDVYTFIANTKGVLGPGFGELIIPDDLPRQLYISRAWTAFEYNDTDGQDSQAVEVEMWVDIAGQSYFSTDPPGLEANYQHDISILETYNWHPIREVFNWSRHHSPPILCDFDNGDLLAVKFACSYPLMWTSAQFQYIVDSLVPIPPQEDAHDTERGSVTSLR